MTRHPIGLCAIFTIARGRGVVTQTSSIADPQGKIWLLRATFFLIIAGFALSNAVALITMRGTQAANRTIAENAIGSIEDVSRIVHDIDQKRLLIDEHIFETAPTEMEAVEKKILQTDADLEAASGVYEPLTTFDGEQSTWESLKEELAELRQPIEKALELSRENQDIQARAKMATIEKRFDVINQTAEKLLALNREAVGSAVDEIRTLQKRSRSALAVITLAGTLLSLFAAVSVTRIIRRRDEQIAQDALALEARNRELDAFAGRVAHDLRGPLTNVSLSAATLASEARAQEESTHAVLRRGITRMEFLIGDLLALSRIDAEPRAISQTSAIEQILKEELAPQVKSLNGILRIQLEPAAVRCSEGLLRQVLWNITDNAMKYRRTEVQLEIEVEGHIVGNSYQFRISDNGSGMSPEAARHAFEPFFRAEAVRATPGTGLGLSIVKRVIDVSRGTVSIASEVGKGTTFVVHLPLDTSRDQAA